MSQAPPTAPPTPRLLSLDALRGFDMFWILGMEQFAAELARAHPAPWTNFIAAQLDHAPWAGFHFLDLVFPLFIFISGVSLVFSLDRSMETRGRAATARKLALRALILYALGVFYYGVLQGLDHVRWVGVLQRIAICGLTAGMMYTFCSRASRIATTAAILVGYWALLTFVPPPGAHPGDFAEGPDHNLANWLDARFLPGLRWDKTHDPEGFLSTFPAIATCLIGTLAGEFLKKHPAPPPRKALTLMIAGILLAAAGWAWHPYFPVIKKLWTSSYVLVAGGYSLALLGVFFATIDVHGWKRWCVPFVWIGVNPITLYLLDRFAHPHFIVEKLLAKPCAAIFGSYGPTVAVAAVVGLTLLVAWFLYRKRITFRV